MKVSKRIWIAARVVISLVTFIILIWVLAGGQQFNTDSIVPEETECMMEKTSAPTELEAFLEDTSSETEEPVEEKRKQPASERLTNKNKLEMLNYDGGITLRSVSTSEKYWERYYENLLQWFMSNDSQTEMISLWKKTDTKTRNLIVAVKNSDQAILAIFMLEGVKTAYYEDWQLCLENICSSDVNDYSWTAYHEVGGADSENVQLQVSVIINRQNCPSFEATSVRGIITEEGQYSSAPVVTNRIFKGSKPKEGTPEEREDLEKCFIGTLLTLVDEAMQEVPHNVVYAAPRPNGSGIWKTVNGTYYCFL